MELDVLDDKDRGRGMPEDVCAEIEWSTIGQSPRSV